MNTMWCLLDMIKTIKNHTELLDEVVSTANDLRNGMHSVSGKTKEVILLEVFTRTSQNLSRLRDFGSRV